VRREESGLTEGCNASIRKEGLIHDWDWELGTLIVGLLQLIPIQTKSLLQWIKERRAQATVRWQELPPRSNSPLSRRAGEMDPNE
jgi:hypothetical protein